MAGSDSDSESWDLDEIREYNASFLKDSATSADPGVLPSSTSPVADSSASHFVLPHEGSSSKRKFTIHGSSLNAVHQKEAKCHMRPSSSEFKWNTTMDDNSWHFNDYGSSDDDLFKHNGKRTLPSSWTHEKHFPAAQFVDSSISHPGVGDERAIGSDERLIYQAALQDINQPKVEANLPDGLLSVSLLRHQKIALAWMLHKETKSCHCSGGILADDQGLGKTISVIALVLMERSSQAKFQSQSKSYHIPEALNLDDDDDNGRVAQDKGKEPLNLDERDDSYKASQDKGKDIDGSSAPRSVPKITTTIAKFRRQRPAAGTLVVCPASILRLWDWKLKDKVSYGGKLSVLIYHGASRTWNPVKLA